MVTIITEKLKTQTLEDVSGETLPVPVPRSTGNSWTFSTSDLPTYKLTGKSNIWVPSQKDVRETVAEDNSGMPFGSGCVRDPWRWTNQQRGAKEGVRWANWDTCWDSIAGAESSMNQIQQSILEMENIPNTPPAPPKKRHCRSLSIPGEGAVFPSADPSVKQWQPQTSTIWRPVPVKPPRASSNRRKTMTDFEVVPMPLKSTSPQVGTSCKVVTPSPRPLSKSEDLTGLPMRSPTLPEGRPESRPASAAPAFFSPAFVPVEAASDCGEFVLRPGVAADSRMEALRVRSLSMEEPIVGGCSDSESVEDEINNAESEPSSPQRIFVPRCRSQPSVLHERKCLKRRRGEDRPALDFLKMKETAYYRHCHKQGSNRYSEQYKTWSQSLASLFSHPPGCPIKLNTIASSPLDSTSKDSVCLESFTRWMRHDNDTPSSVCATVCSSPSSSKLSSPSPNADDFGTPTPLVITPMAADLADKRLAGKYNEEECQWDSGCSDVQESPEVMSFIDRETEETSCSCEDPERDSTIFDLELNDLDLEQIEKH